MNRKSKAVAGNNGSINSFDVLGDNQRLFGFDYDEKAGRLQSLLTAHLARHKKVIRLFRCFCCEKSCAAKKMSSCLAICRECYQAAQTKGEIGRGNFVEKTLNNFHKFLRRSLTI